ncbi:hypothetical protein [Streptomyces sp. NPDC059398]|uniref:hypothetical protein n=1 Tax=Streptomyces sp. NPDC059398 TaxID=3346820 RepID=UPI0036913451
MDAVVVGYTGTPLRPTHLAVRLPDGQVTLTRRLTTALRVQVSPALRDSGPGRAARTPDGEQYTTCEHLTVEVEAGTTRHGAVTATRVRE